MMLQGMTVEYLVRRTYPVKAGQTVLLHAAAGGVGLIASQWLKHIGATVIGTAGGPEKMALAKAHGCDHVIDYQTEDVAKRVRELTGGKGVPVAYDSVGKDTFQATLDSLSPRGMFVSFGNSSGPVPAFEPIILSAKGSLYFHPAHSHGLCRHPARSSCSRRRPCSTSSSRARSRSRSIRPIR